MSVKAIIAGLLISVIASTAALADGGGGNGRGVMGKHREVIRQDQGENGRCLKAALSLVGPSGGGIGYVASGSGNGGGIGRVAN